MTNLWNKHSYALVATGIAAFFCCTGKLLAQQPQPLLLSEAVRAGVNQYQSIKAKANYVRASEALVNNVKNDYLPNVIAGVQQNFGTINGQFGPAAPVGIMGVSSAGPGADKQSWNAAFGSLYIISTNWEAFTFGRKEARIEAANAQVRKDSADLAQETFVQSVKISGAYLNLLIAQRLILNNRSNLERAIAIRKTVLARTLSGLNPGVDSSIANAEVSRANLTLIEATSNEQQLRNQLVQLLNVSPAVLTLDSSFFKNIPASFSTATDIDSNPQVKFYESRVAQGNLIASSIKKSILPGINLFGVVQTRGSGFDYNYSPALSNGYTKNYFTGINPTRLNYVAGFSVAWNITSPAKIKHQVTAQHFITKAYQDEYDLIRTQLKDQLVLADQRIENALQSYHEVPLQYKAAADAYIQKSVLYKNGLTNINDVQQALYAVNRAETDLSVAYINVWQALLLKAASAGDIDLLLKQVK